LAVSLTSKLKKTNTNVTVTAEQLADMSVKKKRTGVTMKIGLEKSMESMKNLSRLEVTV